MKLKPILLISILFLITMISLGFVIAADNSNQEITNINDSNINGMTISVDTPTNDIHTNNVKESRIIEISVNDLSISDEKDKLVNTKVDKLNSTSKVIVVDGSAVNQMDNPTIQTAIDNANVGDTILITGQNYVHTHLVINKTLTIKSEIGTTMSPCPSNTKGSGGYGIFYVSPEGEGTVIEGFKVNGTIKDGVSGSFSYGIMSTANNVQIINCSAEANTYGILIRNTENNTVINSSGKKSEKGVSIENSSNILVKNSEIINNTKYGVYIGLKNTNITITDNSITYNNDTGILVESSNNVHILNNLIAFNRNGIDQSSSTEGYGIYVRNNLTKLNISGNFIKENRNYAVFDEYTVENLVDKAYDLQIIDANYILNHKERFVCHLGEDNNTQLIIYLYNNLNGGEGLSCGAMYYKDGSNYDASKQNLRLSNIKQTQIGIYSLEILRPDGKIATEFNVVPVIFYINKNNTSPTPQEGDIYKNVTFINGVATVDLRGCEFKNKGNVLTAIVEGGGVSSESLSRQFNISDKDIPGKNIGTKIIASDMTTTPYSGQILKIILKDDNEYLLANQNITVSINGKTYTKVTNAEGEVKLPISLAANNYKVNINYKGTNYYNPSSKNLTIKVIKVKSQIIAPNVIYAPKSGKTYTITLKDKNNKAIVNRNLNIKLNGKTYKKQTNNKGQVNLKITLATKKVYPVYIVFNGDSSYSKTSKTTTITIKQLGTKIVAPNVAYAPKSGKIYTITLKDQNNDLLKKKNINIKLNGKTYKKQTNNKGQVNLKITLANKKTYPMTITFAGTSQYLKTAKTVKIIIKQLATKIIANNVNTSPLSKEQYLITLKDQNNDLLKKKNINIKLNGKTYKKQTNNKGQVSILLNLSKVKTYPMTITFAGTSQYLKTAKATKIIVSKINTKIIAASVSIPAQKPYNYTLTLKDIKGNVLANKNIKISIDSVTYNKTTDKNGNAKLLVNFKVPKTYTATIKFAGDTIYNGSSLVTKITADKLKTIIIAPSISIGAWSNEPFIATLTDDEGNKLVNKTLIISLNKTLYNQTTDENGQVKIAFNKLAGEYNVITSFDGDKTYEKSNTNSKINASGTSQSKVIITNLTNEEIQRVLDNAQYNTIAFIDHEYENISLIIYKPLNIITTIGSKINGKKDCAVFTINANNTNISNFIINPSSGSGIIINNTNNVNINNNTINNTLDESKMPDYNNGSTYLPGYGVSILNSSKVTIDSNIINYFETGVYAEYSNNVTTSKNELTKDNYGIKYGFGVTNTNIKDNNIHDNIGWLTMTMPEGPNGYGIYLNNSAVNVTMHGNKILANYLGISIDCNYSTGIVITGNWISDSVTEGIRFNAGYDLAKDAVEPIVQNNAIYRNAKGPSMMILGEVSANPFGIYGPGEFNESLRLKLGYNWYGANSPATWNLSTNTTGIGTICPRIKTTPISFANITCIEAGKYNITFYKPTEIPSIATELGEFEMFATLNYYDTNKVECVVKIVNGTGIISFDAKDYKESDNSIQISVGSLINSTRSYSILENYIIPQEEIPTN